MAFKSSRLLHEAINKEMQDLTKKLMNDNSSGAAESMIDLRKLIEEMTTLADRPAIDDVLEMSPGDYVKTMKPLVGKYHRQLMVADALCACLNEDLQANGTILMLIGDEKTVVRTAHDASRPEVGLAIEVILASLDSGSKEMLSAGAAELEKMAGLPAEADENGTEVLSVTGTSGDPEKPSSDPYNPENV